jgi:hypothetical protein
MMNERPERQPGWRARRQSGIQLIIGASLVGLALWLAIYRYGPLITVAGLAGRMLFAFKCIAIATLFCFVGGTEAVAHERFQSAAFDPLAGSETPRLKVNLRYLQNTLEQLIVLAVALCGLAAYLSSSRGMRAVLATTVVWIVGRFAFWIGYHRSAAMRGIGAPGMMAALLALLYVGWRIGAEIAGSTGGSLVLAAFFALEALLVWKTRPQP